MSREIPLSDFVGFIVTELVTPEDKNNLLPGEMGVYFTGPESGSIYFKDPNTGLLLSPNSIDAALVLEIRASIEKLNMGKYVTRNIITAENDFFIGTGPGEVAGKSLADVKNILGVTAASSLNPGMIQIATAEEAAAGLSDLVAMTPAAAKAELDKKIAKIVGAALNDFLVFDGTTWNKMTKDQVKSILGVSSSAIIGTTSIPNTGWVANAGDSTLKIDIAIAGVTTTSWVDVAVDKESQDVAQAAGINATVTEYNGGITIYASNAPVDNIPIRYRVVN